MIPLLKKARSRYLDHEVPTNTGTACHLRIQLYECPSVSGVQLHQLDGDIRRQRKGLLGRKVARKLWAIKRLQYHTSIVWYPAPRPCRRAVLACRPQQHAAIPRLVFGAGLAGTPPLFHTPTLLTAVASTKARMQWMAGVMQMLGLSAGVMQMLGLSAADGLTQHVQGRVMPSLVSPCVPPSTPSALLNKLWQLARVARATASPGPLWCFWCCRICCCADSPGCGVLQLAAAFCHCIISCT